MLLKKETHLKLALLLTGLLVFGVSCKEVYLRNPFSTEPPIVLHPILKSDIFDIPAGSAIYRDPDAPAIMAEKSGWFVSDYYIEQIMKTKIE